MKFFKCILLSVLIGCSSTKFSADRNKKGLQDPVTNQTTPQDKIDSSYIINLTCDDLNQEVINKKILFKKDQTTKIKGEICDTLPTANLESTLNVLFVVDTSDSMDENDPLVGSCGRFKAVNGIIGQLKKHITDQKSSINIGMMHFASNAMPLLQMTQLTANFTPDVNGLCKHAASTNYEGAFKLAQSMLAKTAGKQAVYFISDGMPTDSQEGRFEAAARGLEAAENLRAAFKDLIFYAIYLDPNAQQQNLESYQPFQYLVKVTGKKENVKLVIDAESLATEILKFDVPTPVNLGVEKPTINLVTANNQTTAVNIPTVEKIADNKWGFTSESFSIPFVDDAYFGSLFIERKKNSKDVMKTEVKLTK